MSFLEYQDEMYSNAVHDSACLLIASKGIGMEQLMIRLCRTYSDDTSLVIVIGTDADEQQFFTNQLIDEPSVPVGHLPTCITFESANAKKRREIYLKGGVVFVTERILVVDLLLKRVPIDLVTGFIVYNAHNIFDDFQISFILRLYRLQNASGFVKALSQNPQSFVGDFRKLDKIMRSLFTSTLYLWPRFHSVAQSCLRVFEPQVIEISIDMSERMRKIQYCIIDLVEGSLRELSKTNANILVDFDKIKIEDTLSMQFNKFCRLFDAVWHQLSSRAKRLINDIQWLKNLLQLLTQSDVVAFYNQTRSAQESIRTGSDVSDWIFWPSGDQLFRLSKERLYTNPSSTEPCPESNLKWEAFENLIDEIDKETIDIKSCVNVIAIVSNESVTRLLQSILEKGTDNVLRNRIDWFNAIRKGCSISADSLQIVRPGELKVDEEDNSYLPPVKKRSRTTRNPAAEIKLPDNILTMTQIFKKRTDKSTPEVITIDDNQVDCASGLDDDDNDEECVNSNSDTNNQANVGVHHIKLHYFCTRDKSIILESLLHTYAPSYVIMYDLDMESIRKLEVYSAIRDKRKEKIKLYIIQFKDSYDMQLYLTTLKREKEAFEYLIREKATMVIPAGRDGKTEGHPDLVRAAIKPNETTTSRVGGSVSRNDIIDQKILVDMREFRCELPSVIHKRGIDIEPIQLEIGDYILSSDTCVERKSISDLIQSLQSGRLYTQAAVMIRHFERPILLIEFDGNKSFHFKGRYISVGMGYDSYKSKEKRVDLVERLILLTIHQPKLRILWSPSAHFSAELFEYLKLERDQPSVEKIVAISTSELPAQNFADKYDIEAKEFLLNLPGINSRNVYSLMNRLNVLADLIELSLEEIEEVVGSSEAANLLFELLKADFSELARASINSEQQAKKSRLFSCTSRRKLARQIGV